MRGGGGGGGPEVEQAECMGDGSLAASCTSLSPSASSHLQLTSLLTWVRHLPQRAGRGSPPRGARPHSPRAPPPSLTPSLLQWPCRSPQATGGGRAHCQPAELPQALPPRAHRQGDAVCWPLPGPEGLLRGQAACWCSCPSPPRGPGSHWTPPGPFPAKHSGVRKQSPVHRESVTHLFRA